MLFVIKLVLSFGLFPLDSLKALQNLRPHCFGSATKLLDLYLYLSWVRNLKKLKTYVLTFDSIQNDTFSLQIPAIKCKSPVKSFKY